MALTWTQLSPAASPSTRRGHAIAYDPVRDQLVLFGGYASSGVYDETWVYDFATANWIQKSPALSPPGLWGHAMVWDPVNLRVLLFGGGQVPVGSYYNHLYAWDGTNWSVVIADGTAGSPSRRIWPGMCVNTTTQDAILFGGIAVGGGGDGNDETWSLDLSTSTWSQLSPVASPELRWGAALGFHAGSGKVFLYGGRAIATTYTAVWSFDGSTWTKATDAISGVGIWDGALVWDEGWSRLLLVATEAGYSAGAGQMGVWAISETSQPLLVDSGTPPVNRWQFGGAQYRTTNDSVYLFGGADCITNGGKNDTWQLFLGVAIVAPPDRQYRPISSREADTNDACSVRAIRDLTDNINNFKKNVQCPKLISELWPANVGVRPVIDGAVSTSEQMVWPPIPAFKISDGYNKILMTLQHRLLGGTSATWRLYVHNKLYTGPDVPFSTVYLEPHYQVASIVSSSVNLSISNGYASFKYSLGVDRMAYLILTGQPADAGSSAELAGIDVYALP